MPLAGLAVLESLGERGTRTRGFATPGFPGCAFVWAANKGHVTICNRHSPLRSPGVILGGAVVHTWIGIREEKVASESSPGRVKGMHTAKGPFGHAVDRAQTPASIILFSGVST